MSFSRRVPAISSSLSNTQDPTDHINNFITYSFNYDRTAHKVSITVAILLPIHLTITEVH